MFKLLGGRKMAAAIAAVLIQILNVIAGQPLDTPALILAVSGLLGFIFVEGAKDVKNAKGGGGKASLSGKLKESIDGLHKKLDDLGHPTVDVNVTGDLMNAEDLVSPVLKPNIE